MERYDIAADNVLKYIGRVAFVGGLLCSVTATGLLIRDGEKIFGERPAVERKIGREYEVGCGHSLRVSEIER